MEILYETTAKKPAKIHQQNASMNQSLTEYEQEDLVCSVYAEPMDYI